jgi:hypothetical protein
MSYWVSNKPAIAMFLRWPLALRRKQKRRKTGFLGVKVTQILHRTDLGLALNMRAHSCEKALTNYRRYFPEHTPARIFINVPAWNPQPSTALGYAAPLH